MGLFDFLKRSKKQAVLPKQENAREDKVASSPARTIPAPVKATSSPAKPAVRNSPDSYADSSSIAPDERPFYQPDSYYTYYSYPGSALSQKVTPFEDRKKISYPSARGLYVAEIMLLEYCNQGKYPKPASGYPGFWWFKYGIRDVGHALESLEKRGFIQWRSKKDSLNSLKVDELKAILSKRGLPVSGKKADLIERIGTSIPEEEISIPNYTPKYELTDLGRAELSDNGYVPYMHRHTHATTDDSTFGTPFTVWEMNKLFPDGNAKDWRKAIGAVEKKRFGVDMASSETDSKPKARAKQEDLSAQKEEIRKYLSEKKAVISKGIQSKGDGFEEESKGLDYKSIGKDKEALVMFYISIGKGFDAPALYRECAKLLRKYGLLEEELSVLNAGIKNVPSGNSHRSELVERKKKVQELIKKQSV